MRVFKLHRKKDISGVSGVGIVAEGVEFSNGKVALAWHSSYKSIAIYDSIKDVETIHCHGGFTQVIWS
ncbi:MAG: hypothetical protein GWN86_23040 [Desulfobacterales bacterium]|nr:hypothetical protein [Desulfobacterales bacterium]